MKSAVSIIVSLATGLLLACGAGPDASVDEPVTSSPPTADEQGSVTAAAPVCGDGICAPIERLNCPSDCPDGTCGDGVCCHGETTLSCPSDCPRNLPYCYKNALSANEPATEVSDSRVSPMACTTLLRPRYSTYWDSFPIQVDGQVGGCETYDDCTTSCWGTESPYFMHHDFFYCTVCY
ncbi:hypothetical protein ACN28E_41775 [Archangium lansingense]|uniref:hypothetical protein n=1 Tax=Archangium lansingense TaxID=2995310 RepID=UPI003B7FE007